jgi:hypothetical protein
MKAALHFPEQERSAVQKEGHAHTGTTPLIFLEAPKDLPTHPPRAYRNQESSTAETLHGKPFFLPAYEENVSLEAGAMHFFHHAVTLECYSFSEIRRLHP